MDKIVHELKGFNTDVFYGIDFKTEEEDSSRNRWGTYDYRYHCVHCKEKGNISVKILMGVIPEFSVYAPVFRTANIIEQKKNCPNCNVEWKQSQRHVEPRSVQKITFDNGDIMYLYQDVYPRHKDAQPIIRQHKLRIEKATGKMRLSAKDRPTYDVSTIRSVLQMFRSYFSEVPTEFEYYLSRNHRLTDILQYVPNQDIALFFAHVSKNQRRRMYYAYDKHGVKAAYRSILKGKGNKMLYKLLWENLHLLHITNDLVDLSNVDVISNIIRELGLHDITYEKLMKVWYLFRLDFSGTKVHSLVKKGKLESIENWVLQDCYRMYTTLLERTSGDYKLPSHRDFHDLHELLIRDINQVEDSASKEIMLPLTNLKERHLSEYSVKIAETAHDLNLLGQKLNICVAGYRSFVLAGDCVIAYVTKNNKTVACLQVSPETSSLVQAKLACNQPVSSNPDIERIVYSWVKENRLNTKTGDVGFETSFEKLNKIELAHRYEAPKILPNAMRPPVFDIPELPEDFPF